MRTRILALPAASLALSLVCCGNGCGNGKSTNSMGPITPGGDGNGQRPDLPGPAPAPSTPFGTIAYTRGSELRVIEPDGSGDRLVWAAPPVSGEGDLHYKVTSPAWRPDGGELAFASDHQQAFSPYDTDIYAVRGDGQNLRKLTNAPAHDLLGRFPKGTVTVDVQALASGPFFIIVQGAPEPQLVSSSGRLTFKDVADFGSGVQAVVAATGGSRWTGTPVDVQADRTASAGTLAITPLGGIEGYGAGVPVWRSDGRKVGFLGPLCLPAEVPVDPPPGPSTTPLVAAEAAHGLCAIDRGPTAATAGQLALGTIGFDEQGRTFVYVAPEGATSLPAPVLTLDNFRRLTDLHWLPSGSGLIAAWQDDLTDEDINLHELDLASRQTRQLTDFSFGTEKLRRFTVSPDGGTIVFERTDDLLFGKSDLWIANRDGSGLRKLVADAGFPAWNPAAAPKR